MSNDIRNFWFVALKGTSFHKVTRHDKAEILLKFTLSTNRSVNKSHRSITQVCRHSKFSTLHHNCETPSRIFFNTHISMPS